MHAPLHPLDPNWLDFGPDVYRIWLDDRENEFALVDVQDYRWVQEHRWCLNIKKSRGSAHHIKKYARRAVGENAGGQRLKTWTLYLHVAIMQRVQPVPPSTAHTIVDHRNGQSLDCRRVNLRWATPSMNAKNVLGQHPFDLEELMLTSAA